MNTYKAGDRVHVVMIVGGNGNVWDGRYTLYFSDDPAKIGYCIPESSITGPAPAPAVDWSKVPVGADVEVAGSSDGPWIPAWFIRHDEREGIYHCADKERRLNIMYPVCRLASQP